MPYRRTSKESRRRKNNRRAVLHSIVIGLINLQLEEEIQHENKSSGDAAVVKHSNSRWLEDEDILQILIVKEDMIE